MSKAPMEKVAHSHGLNNPNAETIVSCVRYGNVMYSRGLVIPLFVRQLRAGKALSITHPRMTRFMMSLADSIDLIEFAFANARQGDLFIRTAPACTIGDLATAVGNLFGVDAEIDIIGVRHGGEDVRELGQPRRACSSGRLWRLLPHPADTRDLNYSLYFDVGNMRTASVGDYDSSTAQQLDVPAVEQLLLTLPEIVVELAEVRRLHAGVA